MKRFVYLRRYIKLLKQNKDVLARSRVNGNLTGIRYDWLYRLYTVLNLPPDDDENLKRYGYYYMDNMVKNHVAKLNEFLFQLGILEYIRIDTSNVVQIDQYNVKIVLRFKYLNLKRMFRFLIFGLPIIIIAAIVLLFIL